MHAHCLEPAAHTAGDIAVLQQEPKALGARILFCDTGTLPSTWGTIKTIRYQVQRNDSGTLRWAEAEKRSLYGLDLAYNALTGCASKPCCGASLHAQGEAMQLQPCIASELKTNT
jgi:hypothetical protein